MSLSGQQVSSISRQVCRKFPELRGTVPGIKAQTIPVNSGRKSGQAKSLSGQRFLLTYKFKALVSGGKSMSRLVRVVANEQGKVLKMTTSK